MKPVEQRDVHGGRRRLASGDPPPTGARRFDDVELGHSPCRTPRSGTRPWSCMPTVSCAVVARDRPRVGVVVDQPQRLSATTVNADGPRRCGRTRIAGQLLGRRGRPRASTEPAWSAVAGRDRCSSKNVPVGTTTLYWPPYEIRLPAVIVRLHGRPRSPIGTATGPGPVAPHRRADRLVHTRCRPTRRSRQLGLFGGHQAASSVTVSQRGIRTPPRPPLAAATDRRIRR